jgi:transglutaminase-like putative cysteine protease
LHHSTWADDVPFIPYRELDWSRVKRTRYFCYQRFFYAYPGSVHNLHQHLIVVPPPRYADQVVCDQQLTVAPYPADANERVDEFGNYVWDLNVSFIEHEIAFEAIVTVERTANGGMPPGVSRAHAQRFLRSTTLTTPDERMKDAARELKSAARNDHDLAERISAWVSDAMCYKGGVTGVKSTAAEALALQAGLCQDYAHIMIAMCRSVGLPARYVSGHMLADGGSHAWVDVLIPNGDPQMLYPVAFDPTNRRQPNMSYTIIAVGRDYRDVSPASGSFSAPYSGRLQFRKRAGLTFVEFTDGEIVHTGGPGCP